MMTVLIALAIICIMVLSCCKAAGDSDEFSENSYRDHREYEGEDL